MKVKYISDNKECIENSPKGASFLYQNKMGNIILSIANKRWLSSFVGCFMNTKISKIFIKSFIEANNINMSIYEKEKYKCFNDFFARKIKKQYRLISKDKESLISPADSKLLIYEINDNLEVKIKDHIYTLEELLKDKTLSNNYKNGYMLVFRLCVNHYHRYIFVDDGNVIGSKKINGLFHTVGPIAFKKYKVFKENQREYSILNTKNFGQVIQMEVGALMVGKIKNHDIKEYVKGEEKGYFLFGGSTIVLFINDIIQYREDLLNYSNQNIELEVKLGEVIGKKV